MTILPSITTTKTYLDKVKETKTLGLTEVCLFLTGLDAQKRKELYGLLKKSPIKKIPFVHLRADMTLNEVEGLVENFQTEIFNVHTAMLNPLEHDLSKYKSRIYLENTYLPIDEGELAKFPGLCVDFAHLAGTKMKDPQVFEHNFSVISRNHVGCAHISGTVPIPFLNPSSGQYEYDTHFLTNLSQLDYLKDYPASFFPKIMAIELENSLEEQLKAKKYLENLLSF